MTWLLIPTCCMVMTPPAFWDQQLTLFAPGGCPSDMAADPHMLRAHGVAGHSVLVAAHTSAGKTVVAEYAFAMALRCGGRSTRLARMHAWAVAKSLAHMQAGRRMPILGMQQALV